MTSTGRLTLLSGAILFSVPACGGGPTGPTPPPSGLQVSGTYDTAVALDENACGDVTVQPQPTTVTQSPGRVSLTHAGTTFSGPIANDGTFTTEPVAVTGGGTTSTLVLGGRFTTTGFDARVVVDVARAAGACRYVVRWLGTKQGPANVIPG